MTLAAYRKKRDFKRTSEPKAELGALKNGQLRFVVQEHHASRLHFDFRLEMGGVLKSWAVPKGPSLDPDTKRLAVMTEDHPVKYIDFQGHIPEGNYGAGDMAIWDTGSYEVEGDGEAGVRKGKLILHLHGAKLQGEFHMVRMHGEENQWLMMKTRDEYADPTWELEPVLSEGGKKPVVRAPKKTSKQQPTAAIEPVRSKAKAGRMPESVDPMLATLVDALPPGDDYLYELKWDGFRAICFIRNGKAELISRNHNDLSPLFPEIIAAAERLPVNNAVLDGEIVALDADGNPSFQLLQNRTGIKSSAKKKTPPAPVVFYLFDLLYLDGGDYTSQTLVERRAALQDVLQKADSDTLRFSDAVQGEATGKKLLAHAREAHIEGVIAKEIGSPYVTGRGGRWLKIKNVLRQEVVIGGYTQPRRSRKNFGAVVVGLYQGKELHYCGHTGGGFNSASLQQLYERMQPLETDQCPFAMQPKTNEAVQWVKPELVCEVKFSEWTHDGIMRQPIFLGLRDDKAPRDCVREKPKHVAAIKHKKPTMSEQAKENHAEIDELMKGELRGDVQARIGDAVVPLTNLHKKYWPDDGYTKGDLLRYYYQVADTILPHLADRPLILRRYPSGIKGKPFYQHNIEHPPEFLRTWEIEESHGPVRYALCDGLASLLYIVNLGTIAQNPFLSRIGHLDQPDFLVLDLDPENVEWGVVCDVALTLQKVLKQIGLESYAKTSGSTGMHVFVPLESIYSYDQAQGFALLVASVVQKQHADVVTLERMRAKRGKAHIYLDCLQIEQGKSVASAYSVREKAGATVSAPLTWAEVKKGAKLEEFDIKTMGARLKKRGDLFSDVLTKSQRIEAPLAKLEKLLAKEKAS